MVRYSFFSSPLRLPLLSLYLSLSFWHIFDSCVIVLTYILQSPDSTSKLVYKCSSCRGCCVSWLYPLLHLSFPLPFPPLLSSASPPPPPFFSLSLSPYTRCMTIKGLQWTAYTWPSHLLANGINIMAFIILLLDLSFRYRGGEERRRGEEEEEILIAGDRYALRWQQTWRAGALSPPSSKTLTCLTCIFHYVFCLPPLFSPFPPPFLPSSLLPAPILFDDDDYISNEPGWGRMDLPRTRAVDETWQHWPKSTRFQNGIHPPLSFCLSFSFPSSFSFISSIFAPLICSITPFLLPFRPSPPILTRISSTTMNLCCLLGTMLRVVSL